MKENVERSDPVDGFTDVTTEQLDARHAECSEWDCHGPVRARERRRAAKAIADGQALTTDVAERLQRVTEALTEVGEAMQRVHLGVHEEPLAEWERELLQGIARSSEATAEREAAERELRTAERVRRIHAEEAERQSQLYRESLQAGLQHQRIGNIQAW